MLEIINYVYKPESNNHNWVSKIEYDQIKCVDYLIKYNNTSFPITLKIQDPLQLKSNFESRFTCVPYVADIIYNINNVKRIHLYNTRTEKFIDLIDATVFTEENPLYKLSVSTWFTGNILVFEIEDKNKDITYTGKFLSNELVRQEKHENCNALYAAGTVNLKQTCVN